MGGDGNSSERILFWDYPHYHGSGWTPGAAIRKGDWKLIHWYESDEIELYNLAADAEESVDVSEKFPDKKQSLLAELNKQISDNKGQFPKPNQNYQSP